MQGPHVTFYVREPVPYGAQERLDRVHSRLRQLEKEGAIASLTVETWGKLLTEDDAFTEPAYDRYAELRSWAESCGHGLGPGFDRRTLDSAMVDERRDVVVLPVMCLAIYDEDHDLLAVYPCSEDDRVHTIEECLGALETGEWPVQIAQSAPAPPNAESGDRGQRPEGAPEQ